MKLILNVDLKCPIYTRCPQCRHDDDGGMWCWGRCGRYDREEMEGKEE